MNKDTIVRSFATVLEMLRDRGEDIGDASPQHIEEVLKVDSLKSVVEILIGNTKIIYYTPSKFKWGNVKDYFVLEDGIAKFMLIVSDNITTTNVKSIQSLGLDIEVHVIKRLLFNITKHALQPKFEIIREKAAMDALVETYKLKNKFQFPILLKADPIAKYYGLKGGEVIKVTRTSPTAGEYIEYRCCL